MPGKAHISSELLMSSRRSEPAEEPYGIDKRALEPGEKRQPCSLHQPETDESGAAVMKQRPPGQIRSGGEIIQEDMQQVGKGAPEAGNSDVDGQGDLIDFV